ncbi:unnamed protein product [Rhodiola kirilowii]
MAPRHCQVCNTAPSKYKCPACIIPYCSLDCFKKHKEIPCAKPVVLVENSERNNLPAVVIIEDKDVVAKLEISKEKPSEESSFVKLSMFGEKSSPSPKVQRPYYVDDPHYVLPQTELQAIAASTDIRESLKNEEIQQLILGIDGSQNPELELDNAMRSEVFQNFTDKILSTLSAEVRRK